MQVPKEYAISQNINLIDSVLDIIKKYLRNHLQRTVENLKNKEQSRKPIMGLTR